MSEYFRKPNSFGANVNVELDLSNYATKSDLENATGAIHHLLLKRLI